MYSASFYEEEEEDLKKKEAMTSEERAREEEKRARQDQWLMRGTVAFSIVISVALLSCFRILWRGFSEGLPDQKR